MPVVIGDAWIGPNYPVTQAFAHDFLDADGQWHYRRFGLAGHEGVDFGLPTGVPVIAVEAGVVLRVGPLPGWGNYGIFVEVWHDQQPGMKFATLYAHLKSAAVKAGDRVIKAQLLGYSDNTGSSTAPHLHFGLCYTDLQGVRLNQNNGYKGWLDADDPTVATWEITNPVAPAVPVPTDPCAEVKAQLSDAKAQLAAAVANAAAADALNHRWEDWYANRPR